MDVIRQERSSKSPEGRSRTNGLLITRMHISGYHEVTRTPSVGVVSGYAAAPVISTLADDFGSGENTAQLVHAPDLMISFLRRMRRRGRVINARPTHHGHPHDLLSLRDESCAGIFSGEKPKEEGSRLAHARRRARKASDMSWPCRVQADFMAPSQISKLAWALD